MRRTVRHKTRAAHVYGAHVRAAATHADSAAAEVRGAAAHMHSAATAEVGTAATPAEVSATATTASAEMGAPAATAAAETGVCRFSGSRQTKGKGYCGCARRDFPHDMTSSSGPNA
jgi:hypothetical protein